MTANPSTELSERPANFRLIGIEKLSISDIPGGCNGKSSNSSSSILHRESIMQRKDNVPRSIQRPANHVRYIVLQVQECELIKVSIGDLEENIRIARELYMLSTWNKMHQDLSNGLLLKKMGFGLKFIRYCAGGQCPSRKHILKDMNSTFEEIHRTQSRWLIPDLQLRQELHQSITERMSSMRYPHDCKSLYKTARKVHRQFQTNWHRETKHIRHSRRMQWEELEFEQLHRESILQRKDNVPRSIQRRTNHQRRCILEMSTCS
nr:exocyst complex component EXO70A1 [Ipomoea batatas]